ncbi:MAG TPA: hypothetical protein VD790_07885 [Thermoleophilaceae bacterium]|nr:hypothetical protein [Thermoleophilaceae bacterium]
MAEPEHAMDARGGGWLVFAGVMFMLAAGFNTIYGIAALVNDDYFAADELLFGDLSTWGILYLVAAAVQAGVTLLLFTENNAGAIAGVCVAMLNGTLALLTIGAYPLWSVAILVVDGLIIYGLTVYGFDRRPKAT